MGYLIDNGLDAFPGDTLSNEVKAIIIAEGVRVIYIECLFVWFFGSSSI